MSTKQEALVDVRPPVDVPARRGRCFECRRKVHAGESRVVWLKERRIERRLCGLCLAKRGLSVKPREYTTRAPSTVCTKCRQEPRRPGQRWGHACHKAYMVDRRLRAKAYLKRLEAIAVEQNVPRETPPREQDSRVRSAETRLRISAAKLDRNAVRRKTDEVRP